MDEFSYSIFNVIEKVYNLYLGEALFVYFVGNESEFNKVSDGVTLIDVQTFLKSNVDMVKNVFNKKDFSNKLQGLSDINISINLIIKQIDSDISTFNLKDNHLSKYKDFIFRLFILYIYLTLKDFYEPSTMTLNDQRRYDLTSQIKDRKNEDVSVYFRGHEKVHGSVIPSLFRNSGFKNTVLDYKVLNMFYKKPYDYLNLFNGCFDKITTSIDYNFLCYMQHSASISPLLDFSKSDIIALSFTCENKTPTYDGEMWVVEIRDKYIQKDESAINSAISNINVVFLSTLLELVTFILKQKSISIDDFLPDIFLVDKGLNDRMNYQKGVFIYFNNYVIYKKKMFFSQKLSKNQYIKIKRYIVTTSYKSNMQTLIVKNYEQYQYDKLLQPYDIFMEKRKIYHP